MIRSSHTRRGRAVAAVAVAALAVAATSMGAHASSPPTAPAGSAGPSGGTLVVGITTDPDTLFPWKATQFQAVHLLEQHLRHAHRARPGPQRRARPRRELGVRPTTATTLTLHLRDGVDVPRRQRRSTPRTSSRRSTAIQDEATAAVALPAAGHRSPPSTRPIRRRSCSPSRRPTPASSPGSPSLNMAILSADDTERRRSTTTAQRHRRRSSSPAARADAVDHPRRQRRLLGRRAEARRPRVPRSSRTRPRSCRHCSPATSSSRCSTTRSSPRRPRAAASPSTATPQLSLPRAAAQRPRGAAGRCSTSASPSSAPSTARQVLDTAALGEGEVTGPITSPAYKSDPNARPCPTRDVAKAKAVPGRRRQRRTASPSTPSCRRASTPPRSNEAQNLQAQLADAGITLDLETLDYRHLRRPLARRRLRRPPSRSTAAAPTPTACTAATSPAPATSTRSPASPRPSSTQLFAQGKATIDPAKPARPIYTQISKYLEDNAVWVWLFSSYTYTATTPNVSGFIPMANGSLQYLRQTSLQ